MTEKPEIQCNDCGWQGDSLDLLCSDEDIKDQNKSDRDYKFIYCPNCGSTDIEDHED